MANILRAWCTKVPHAMKQNVIEESISNLSKDFATNRDKTINQMEKTNKMVSEIEKSSCDRTRPPSKAKKDAYFRFVGIFEYIILLMLILFLDMCQNS